MATYVPNLGIKKCNLATAAYVEETFATCPEPSLNQVSSTGPFSMTFSGSSNYCVDSAEGRNEMMFIPPMATDPVGSSITDDSLVNQNVHYQGQGLSLSLGKQIPSPVSLTSFQYHYPNPSLSSDLGTCLPSIGSNQNVECFNMASGFMGMNTISIKTESFGNQIMQGERYEYETSGFNNNFLNSKYLEAVQGLLDEVVNVRKALNKHKNKLQGIGSDALKKSDLKLNGPSDPSDSTANSSCELSPAEQQDLQNKKTKLMSMLDDVSILLVNCHHFVFTIHVVLEYTFLLITWLILKGCLFYFGTLSGFICFMFNVVSYAIIPLKSECRVG